MPEYLIKYSSTFFKAVADKKELEKLFMSKGKGRRAKQPEEKKKKKKTPEMNNGQTFKSFVKVDRSKDDMHVSIDYGERCHQ